MAVQFNLLPDVKLEFDRQQRTKRFLYTVALLASAVALTLLVVSYLSVNILQKKLLNDANNDIKSYSQKLKNIPDLEKVLTVQNQLNTLPGLHQAKHITSRLFTYMPQITPAKVFIGQVTVDLSANTITINGTTDTLQTVNAFVDTMKFTNYKIGDDDGQDAKSAFSNVVLSTSGRSDKGASYSITANYDPLLFDGTQDVVLVVPNEVTTRSVKESPDIGNLLFNGQTGKPDNQQGNQ